MRSHSSLLTILLLLVPVWVSAQISTDPAFPSTDEPVTIIFDASGTALEDYDGDIYAHTGVILDDEDRDSGNWSNVIADWDENIDQARLEQDDQQSNIWRLQIDNIRDFYDLSEDATVYQLAFVFRNEDGSAQTEDLFVDLIADELTVRFDRPQVSRLQPFFADIGDEVEIEISAFSPDTEIQELRLEIDDEEVASTDEDQLSYSLEVENEGRTNMRAVVVDEEDNTAEETSFIIVNEDVVEEARPDGIEDGITYHEDDDSKVTLSMFAPENDFVYVLGDFNDWEVDPDYMMKRDDTGEFDGPHYWMEIDGLEPGDEYGFQYFVDGEVRTADLFSEKVLDPWNDSFLIDDGVYPDLMEYPEGKTEHMVSVLETGQDEYDWQATDYERPDQEELVIYELVIRDFLDEGTYSNMADTLDYFDRLGVNAVELMPVSQFDGNISWGYNPSHHLAVEKAYGPREDLKRFIDEAHQRGIAVILDVVYNHATDNSPLIRLYGSSQDDNPFVGPGHAYNVFNHLNHDHPYIQYWVDRANEFWLEEYNVDGFRFDLTKGFVANDQVQSNTDQYNQERVDNLRRMGDEMWSVDDESYIILEHFQREEELELYDHGTDQGYPGMMFWNGMSGTYSEASMGYDSNLEDTYFRNLDMDIANSVTYMESHDEQWMMFRNLTYGYPGVDAIDNYDGDYQVIDDLFTSLKRQELAGAFFLSVPGPRMLWQFGELGYGGGENECLKPGDGSDGDCQPDDPGRTDPKPVRWEYYDDSRRSTLFDTWSWLLKLRHEFEVFSSNETEVDLEVYDSESEADPGSGDIKRIRLSHDESMDVTIVGNFDAVARTAEPEFHEEGTWYDYFHGEEVTVSEDQAAGGDSPYSIELEPGEFRVFTSEDTGLTPPENAGIITSTEEDPIVDESPQTTRLKSNYPNPFNPDTNIPFELAEAEEVTIRVYDVLGREVKTLMQNEQLSAGTHQVTFDGSGMSSGTYIIRMETSTQSFSSQMMLVK